MACVYLILLLYYPVDVQPHVDVQGIAVSIIHFNLKKKDFHACGLGTALLQKT